MMAKIAKAADKAAKILILAALAGALVFTGWRIATRKAYIAHEKAQCGVMAASAALCTADALTDDVALAELVANEGSCEYISDHMKMPDNMNISVKIEYSGGAFFIEAKASSGWNSRSPQNAIFTLRLERSGKIDFESEEAAETARLLTEAGAETAAAEKTNEHIFTFPHERPCPVTFSAKSAEVGGFDENKVWILFFDK